MKKEIYKICPICKKKNKCYKIETKVFCKKSDKISKNLGKLFNKKLKENI